MKAIFDFFPADSSDNTITISASSFLSGFPTTNLKYIHPVRSWKTNNVVTESWVKYAFGGNVTYDSLVLNRFNFAAFKVYYSTNDSDYTLVEDVSGLTIDEVYDENYMHRYVDLTGLTYRYIKVVIPAQTPLFETTYFKLGNMYIGNAVEIWNPRPGFNVNYVPRMYFKEMYSGYVNKRKIGRTRRVWNYSVDKVTLTEYNKIRNTYDDFIMYLDFESDKQRVYLVRFSKDNQKTYEIADRISGSFEIEEIV